MTPPADLAALRTLIEVGQLLYRTAGHHLSCQFAACTCGAVTDRAIAMTEWVRALPAAQEALERIEDRLIALHIDPTGHLHRCARVNGQWQCAPDCPGKRAETDVQALAEALERIERQQANYMDTNDYTGVQKTPAVRIAEQAARIARLEGVLESLLVCAHGDEGTCGCRAIDHAALGRPPHDADTAEWQRVRGAAKQAERDVAYWRKRAENAEARAVQEGRDE